MSHRQSRHQRNEMNTAAIAAAAIHISGAAYHKLAERLERYSEPEALTSCTLWFGTIDKDGYGRMSLRCKKVRAHRVAWELAHGPIPPGFQVCHRCDTPACINPAHLFLGTHTDNQADCIRKGRKVVTRGEAHGRAKLTIDQVREIRERCALHENYGVIAADFGVSRAALTLIHQRKNWSHLAEGVG